MLMNLFLLLAFLAGAFANKAIPPISWQSVAIDASGKYHVAAAAYNNDWDQGYPLYISDDYGVNWKHSKSPAYDWRNTYSDASGQVLIGYAVYNSFAVNSYPPLYISKDRGNTWETGASTSSFPVVNNIIGTNSSSLWSVVNSRLYHSVDVAHTWTAVGNIPSKYGTAYTAVIGPDFAIDTTGKFLYVICDGGLCVSHNSGQTYTANFTFLANSVKVDPTGAYAFVLTDKALSYSSDYGYTFTTLKDYTTSGAPVVTKTFLSITNDHTYVYTLEKASSGATSLVRTSVASKTSTNLFTISSTINDAAVSASGNSMIVSCTNGLFYTSQNSGSTWTTHDLEN